MKEKRSLELVVAPSLRIDPAADPPLVKCQMCQNTDDITPLVPAVSGLISYFHRSISDTRILHVLSVFSLNTKHHMAHRSAYMCNLSRVHPYPLPPFRC